MRLDLKGFFSSESEKKEKLFDFSFSMSDIEIDGSQPFVSPVEVSGVAKSENGAVRIEAEVSYDYFSLCDRCLAEINEKVNKKFEHLLLLSEIDSDDDLYIRVQSEEIDLAELIREDIILSLPMVHLCKPNCKGLCSQCGANLNFEECSCGKDIVDPRLEILKTLLNND